MIESHSMSVESIASWKDPGIAQGYIDAISDSDRHIAINKLHYHDPNFYTLLPDLSAQTVLDIGCGSYYMDQDLQAKYPDANFIGLDYPAMFSAVRSQSEDIEQRRPINLVGASANRLPFANNSIDFVLSSLLFHWLGEANQTASEMHRVMKPGAGFVISVAHPDYFKVGEFDKEDENSYTFKRTRSAAVQEQLPVMLSTVIGPITYYSRPVGGYKSLFEEVGFTSVVLYEPLFTDHKKLKQYEHLRRHAKYPLHLFVTGAKES